MSIPTVVVGLWNWPDESGHIWEAQSPHLLYANKGLKINTLDKEVLQGSIKLAFAKPLQIKGSRRKLGSYKFPNVSTVMWPSPVFTRSGQVHDLPLGESWG